MSISIYTCIVFFNNAFAEVFFGLYSLSRRVYNNAPKMSVNDGTGMRERIREVTDGSKQRGVRETRFPEVYDTPADTEC